MTTSTETLAPMITEQVLHALSSARECDYPFRHWEVQEMLPKALTDQILAIRLPRPEGFTYDGTRASDSQLRPGGTPPQRMFVNQEIAAERPFFKDLVDSFMDASVLKVVHEKYGVDLTGLYLRVEYINDFDGFFLDPHKDIVEKRFTLLFYLGDGPEHMGTDFYDSDLKCVKTAKYAHNSGYIFTPGDDTWHGLERKPIPDRRASMLINYVTFKTDWPL